MSTTQERFDYQVPADFTLFHGAPIRPLLRLIARFRPKAAGDARRAEIISTVAPPMMGWLPMFLLSIWEGTVWAGVAVPFLHDIEVQVRFLVALPLLIFGQLYADRVLNATFEKFVDDDIVAPSDVPRFDAALDWAARVSRSPILSVGLVALVYLVGPFASHTFAITDLSTWHGVDGPLGQEPTAAGSWSAWVAMPIFQFYSFRWFIRLLLLWALLLRISRMRLRLVGIDPDCAGGLGFLGTRLYAFVPFLFAEGALVAGVLANQILYDNKRLTDFGQALLAAVTLLIILMLGPLTTFMPVILREKRRGRSLYGRLATSYVQEFEKKWLLRKTERGDLLGSADISSLADLGNAHLVLERMRPFPFGKRAVLLVVIAFAIPIAPLVLTLVPLKEILSYVVKMLV